MVKEIRVHARAGQGAITVANLLGDAAFRLDKYALTFSQFGAARMGAPMNAFVRLSDKPVRDRSAVYQPDYLIVMDTSLMQGFNVFEGVNPEGIAILNQRSKKIPNPPEGKVKLHCVPGNEIATEVFGRPLGNTTLLGAFAAATGEVSLKAVQEAIKTRFPGELGQKNAEAARRGYEYIRKG